MLPRVNLWFYFLWPLTCSFVAFFFLSHHSPSLTFPQRTLAFVQKQTFPVLCAHTAFSNTVSLSLFRLYIHCTVILSQNAVFNILDHHLCSMHMLVCIQNTDHRQLKSVLKSRFFYLFIFLACSWVVYNRSQFTRTDSSSYQPTLASIFGKVQLSIV